MSVVCRFKINQEREVYCAFILGLLTISLTANSTYIVHCWARVGGMVGGS
jgi:hypothetical protein